MDNAVIAASKTSMRNRAVNSGPATPHPDYLAGGAAWDRVRACHDGADAVKANAEAFLPRPVGMSDESYVKYLLRANFLPATRRTEEVLSGLLLSEPPEAKAPAAVLSELEKDVTLTGQPLAGFAQDLITELLIAGRVGVILDFPDTGGGRVRPYWCLRSAEDIVFWRAGMSPEGPERLTRLVLREDVLVEDKRDPYALVMEHRIREYLLEEDGTVAVRVWAFRNNKWEIIERMEPNLHGEPLRMIPAMLGNARRVGNGIEQPPLLSIADLSLSHYRSSADLEQGNYYASLPTVYTIGAQMPAGAPHQQGIPTNQGQTHGITRDNTGVKGYRIGSGKVLELPEKDSQDRLPGDQRPRPGLDPHDAGSQGTQPAGCRRAPRARPVPEPRDGPERADQGAGRWLAHAPARQRGRPVAHLGVDHLGALDGPRRHVRVRDAQSRASEPAAGVPGA